MYPTIKTSMGIKPAGNEAKVSETMATAVGPILADDFPVKYRTRNVKNSAESYMIRNMNTPLDRISVAYLKNTKMTKSNLPERM